MSEDKEVFTGEMEKEVMKLKPFIEEKIGAPMDSITNEQSSALKSCVSTAFFLALEDIEHEIEEMETNPSKMAELIDKAKEYLAIMLIDWESETNE